MSRKPSNTGKPPPADEGGIALVWVLLAVVGLSFMGIAGHHIAQSNQLITENFEVEARAQYAADGTLEQYMATFASIGVTNEEELTYVDTAEVGEEALEDAVEADALDDFLGSDLVVRNFTTGDVVTTVRPLKVIEDLAGDVYLLRVAAQVPDARQRYPTAERELRTLARVAPMFNVLGPMIAPNGIISAAGSEHVHMDGKKKGKGCGVGEDAAPLVVPAGQADFTGVNKLHIKPAPKDATYDEMMAELDQTTTSYQELVDSLNLAVSWNTLVDPATWTGSDIIIVPDDIADFEDIDFEGIPADRWPAVLVRGDLQITKKLGKGHGLLIVDGELSVGPGTDPKLDWRGVIMTGEEVHVNDDAHLHSKGVLVTGLACTDAELAAGTCVNTTSGDSHLDIKNHACDALAALAQTMILRPVTPTRHTRLY